LEEPRMVAMLQMIGCTIWQVTAEGKQYRITGHRGHFGGSLDAVILGIPDLPEIPVLGEFKTHGEKSFLKLVSEGVLSAKWEHFIQMQIYMGKNNLTWALYMAVSKNTDEIHLELVQFDAAQYQKYLDRSRMIIDSPTPPPKINQSSSWFKCKFCDAKDICHNGEPPARNCRTCEHSIVGDNGAWFCSEDRDEPHLLLTPDDQRRGCPTYTLNPVFLQK